MNHLNKSEEELVEEYKQILLEQLQSDFDMNDFFEKQ